MTSNLQTSTNKANEAQSMSYKFKAGLTVCYLFYGTCNYTYYCALLCCKRSDTSDESKQLEQQNFSSMKAQVNFQTIVFLISLLIQDLLQYVQALWKYEGNNYTIAT